MSSTVILVTLFLSLIGIAAIAAYLFKEKQKLSHVKDADRKNQ
ncbi:hypothetical protein ACLHZ0_13085 [Aeromonas salmonicida]|nr:hypothetical protein [Aeromonas sp. QDB14]